MSISNFGATHHYNSLSEDMSVRSRSEKQPSILLMYGRQLGLRFLLCVVFVHLHFLPIPKLCQRNRSPARTVTKRGKVHMGTSSVTGEASGRAWKSGV